MDIRVKEILLEKVSSDWQRFARCCFTDFDKANAITDHMNGDVTEDNILKMRCLLDKLYTIYPEDYKTKIISSLRDMDRNDVLKDLSNLDISEIRTALKSYYPKNYGKINELQPLLKAPAKVDLINNFVDLCIVDAGVYQKDIIIGNERKKFLEKQMNYKPTSYKEIFTNENPAILISGIAGIGKTWLLRKCLLDWSKDLIWKNVDLVFYLECRRLHQYQNISNVNELLNVFYNDILNDFDISKHEVMFIIDGLDEFKYLNELINPSLSCKYPIVNVLVEILKYKYVLAGRVYAIDQYQMVSTDHHDMLTIQIMRFNKSGINNYIDTNVIDEHKEVVKRIFKESSIAKSMASVPFYLSSMCKIITELKPREFSFLTMTDLYSSIFLYFLQKHIIKNDGLVYKMMENDNNKKYILNICKIAYELFIENKIIFSKEEVLLFINNFNEVEDQLFGFIERIETHRGYHYQFAHLTLMEFCASLYAYNNFSSEQILTNQKLNSCLSMICGLSNKSENNLLKFLVNLNNANKEKMSIIHICDLLSSCGNRYYKMLFIECFYESQSLFTDEINTLYIDKQWSWEIWIKEGKTSYETSCEYYFVNHFINYGRQLTHLSVHKNILSDEEINLVFKCSTNVRDVCFYCPIKFNEWKPKDKIKRLRIDIQKYLISKKDFKDFVPWINLCEELHLTLHDDIDFIENIYKWVCRSNIKMLDVWYRKKHFQDLNKFRSYIIRKKIVRVCCCCCV